MTSETLVCSVLLPERFGACAPCTFGTQLNGILQSSLPVRSFHSGRFIGLYLIDGRMLPHNGQLCNPLFEIFMNRRAPSCFTVKKAPRDGVLLLTFAG